MARRTYVREHSWSGVVACLTRIALSQLARYRIGSDPGCRARTTAAGQLSRSRSGRPSRSFGGQLEAPSSPGTYVRALAVDAVTAATSRHSITTGTRDVDVDRARTFATGRRCHGQVALHHARDDGSPVHRRPRRERCD
jgi:hypothetical protein